MIKVHFKYVCSNLRLNRTRNNLIFFRVIMAHVEQATYQFTVKMEMGNILILLVLAFCVI